MWLIIIVTIMMWRLNPKTLMIRTIVCMYFEVMALCWNLMNYNVKEATFEASVPVASTRVVIVLASSELIKIYRLEITE